MLGHGATFHSLMEMHNSLPLDWRCRQMTLLHWAAYGGDVDCIQSLIDQGFDVNAHCLENYVNIDFAVCGGVTPIMLAAQHNHSAAVDVLLQYGADVNCVDLHGQTVLLHAVKHDSVNCVQNFLKYGVHPDGNMSIYPSFIDSELFPYPGLPLSPLMYAIKENSIRSAKALIQANCDMELVSKVSSDLCITPFEFALYRKRLFACKLFLACGLRPMISNAAVMQEGLAWIAQEDECFFTDVMLLLISVQRLSDIARQAIRKCIGVRLLHVLQNLPLPSALKEFLIFADVEV